MRIYVASFTRIGYTHGTQLLQPTGDGVRTWYPRIGGSAQILVQNGGYILYMITATEVNTEYRKHDIAVLIAIVRTAEIKPPVYQFVQSCAFKFVHSIKNSAVGDYVIIFYCYFCHVI